MNKNKQEIGVTDLQLQKTSTHKKLGDNGEQIHMYTITFKLGSKSHSQTKHMTERQAENYVPRIETVYAGQRALQKSCYQIKED